MLQLSGNLYNIQKLDRNRIYPKFNLISTILYEKDRKTAISSSSRSFRSFTTRVNFVCFGIDPFCITPLSQFGGPPGQSTWMFTKSLTQEWLGRVFWHAAWCHYANGLFWSVSVSHLKFLEIRVQWIPSVLRKTLNSCWPKTFGKKDMEKIWKIMGWSALLPKIKKRAKTLRDPTIITFPHFLRTLGVFRRQMCPVTSGRVDNCVRVGQRPYACLTISGSGVRCAANARHNRGLHIRFSLMKKVLFGRFQPLSFDFITRNNGSWAF